MKKKFRINFDIDGHDDSYVVEGETIEEVKSNNRVEMKKRGLDYHDNHLWSEDLRQGH